jgi:hypothetical protein
MSEVHRVALLNLADNAEAGPLQLSARERSLLRELAAWLSPVGPGVGAAPPRVHQRLPRYDGDAAQ